MKLINRGEDIVIGLDFLYCGNTSDIRPIFTQFRAEFYTTDEANTVVKSISELRKDADGDYYVILNADDYQYLEAGAIQYKIAYAISSNEFTDTQYNKIVKGCTPYKLVDMINASVNKGVIFVDSFPLVSTVAKNAIYVLKSTGEMRATYDGENWVTLGGNN